MLLEVNVLVSMMLCLWKGSGLWLQVNDRLTGGRLDDLHQEVSGSRIEIAHDWFLSLGDETGWPSCDTLFASSQR